MNIAIVPQSTSVAHSGDNREFYAFMTQVQGQGTGGTKVITYADSAASEHCFTDIADFITYELYKGSGRTAMKGGQFTILGTGRVIKQAVYDKCIIKLSFKNAYHCPDLSHNLISIGHLDKTGCFSIFGSGGITFLNPLGNPFLYGKGIGTMYEVELYSPTRHIDNKPLSLLAAKTVTAALEARTAVLAFATHSLDKPTDINTWHQRLGHPSYNMVESMYRKGTVEGLNIMTLTQQPSLCEDCIMGKQTHCPFDGNTHPEMEVLECIHIDLWRPFHIVLTGGK